MKIDILFPKLENFFGGCMAKKDRFVLENFDTDLKAKIDNFKFKNKDL